MEGGSCHNNIPLKSTKLRSPSSGVTFDSAEIHWWGSGPYAVYTCSHRLQPTYLLIYTHTGRLPAVDSTDWCCTALNGPTSYPYCLLLIYLKVTGPGKATCHVDWTANEIYKSLCCLEFCINPPLYFLEYASILVAPGNLTGFSFFSRIISQIWSPMTASAFSACRRRYTPIVPWWWSSAMLHLMVQKTQPHNMLSFSPMLHSTCK